MKTLEEYSHLINPWRASVRPQQLSGWEWGGGGSNMHRLEQGMCSGKLYFFIQGRAESCKTKNHRPLF